MNTTYGHLFKTDLSTAQAVLKAALHFWHRLDKQVRIQQSSLRTFVTVSRQPGAGGFTFAQRLVARLNGLPYCDWTVWDNELFDRVCLDKSMQDEVLQVLAEQPLDWVHEMAGNATTHTRQKSQEFLTYQRVAMMLRALAMAGHTVLVGRGGQFITEKMGGGIHIRLIAPLEHRIQHMMKTYDLTERQAASQITRTEHDRELFYHNYWIDRNLGPETFAITLNAGQLSVDEMVECVLPLIRMRDTQLEPTLTKADIKPAAVRCC